MTRKPVPPAKHAQRAKPKRPPHRPPYEPTDAGRSDVIRMVLADIDQDLMARCLGISPPTLRKAYRRELDVSYAKIKAEIVGKLVTKARGGDLKAQIFYLETHGWVKSERLLIADVTDDPTGMSDADIEARITKLRGKGVARTPGRSA
jgi:hypothetical protein